MPSDMHEAITGEPPAETPTARALSDYDAPLWLQNLTYPAQVDRALLEAVWPTSGVTTPGGLAVSPRAEGANLSVDVVPGTAIIEGTDGPAQGKYLGRLRNRVNVPLTSPPDAGLTRIDLIVARIYDHAVTAGGRNEVTVEDVVLGTQATNPVPPAVPRSAVPLAEIRIASDTPAITAPLITNRRVWINQPAQAVLAGSGVYTTDPNGVFIINLPAGGRLVAPSAIYAGAPWAIHVAWDSQFSPVGSNHARFVVCRPSGDVVAGTAVPVGYQIVYTPG